MALLSSSGERIVRVAICIPCQDTVMAAFALDLAHLVGRCASRDLTYTIIQNRGTIIPQQRAVLVRAAIEWQATHVLWLDSDMRFPADALERLLAHEQPLVACNYPTRRAPILPTAEHRDKGYLFTTDDAEGLEEVTHCGMGLMLVDMTVYAKTPEPWFMNGYSQKDREYSGEDFFFCRRAKEAGFVTLIDQSLSREVKHIGAMEFRSAHTIVTRDAYAGGSDAV